VPRAKKQPGQAVDPRNGQRISPPAESLRKFALPRRSDGLDYDLRTRRMWKALWDDQRLAAMLSPVDRELAIRWAQSVDDWIKALAAARADPVTRGSMGQQVASPLFAVAAQALAVAERCEQQIGIGALNRARLGIAVLAEQSSLLDLAGKFPGGGGSAEPDPRLS
jgi:P27 family predicted phage terminase small subunit